MTLNKKLALVIGGLFLVLVTVWFSFQNMLAGYLQHRTDEMTRQTMEYMLNDLESRFAQMERLSEQLAGSPSVKTFMETADTAAYYAAAREIEQSVLAGDTAYTTADNLVLYNGQGAFYRFSGALSNADCQSAYQVISGMSTTRHAVMELGNRQFLAYGIEAGPRRGQGIILMLVDRDKLLGVMQSDRAVMQVALALDGEIVVATDPEMLGSYTGAYAARSASYLSQKVGNTPFEVLVFGDNEYYGSIGQTFTLASLFTGAAVAGALIIFLYVLRGQFFQPMMETIHNIDAIHVEEASGMLPPTTGLELNRLIDNINGLLLRTRERDRAVFEAEARLSQVQIQRQRAEIYALKKQINAHFTINVLGAIQTLTARGEAEAAGRLSAGLSHLIRYAYSEDEYVGILDEMFTLDHYVEIMHWRYGKDISFDYDIDDSLYHLQMPRMLLQPLVENAIIHGFMDLDGPAAIGVNARSVEGQRVRIAVSDNGRGMDGDKLEALRQELVSHQTESLPQGISGVALHNIRLRLLSFYGDLASVEVDSEPGRGTTVTLTLPYHR